MTFTERSRLCFVALALVYCLPTSVRAEIPLLLTDQEQKFYYDQTLAADGRVGSGVAFKFIEGIPLIAKVKTVSSETQCISALVLGVFHQLSNEVNMITSREMIQLAKEPAFAHISQGKMLEALHALNTARRSDGSTRGQGRKSDDRHSRTHDGSIWAGVQGLVPEIEELAKKAGYIDISETATPGIAVSLLLSERSKTMSVPEAVEGYLGGMFMLCNFEYNQPLSWDVARQAIDRDIPLAASLAGGESYLVVGYVKPRDGSRILLAYAMGKIEGKVSYGGRIMMEGRLDEYMKKHPPIDQWSQPRYSDVLSDHKQYQLPGFCGLRYSEELRFSYIQDARADVNEIKLLVRRAYERAASAESAEVER